MKKPIIKKPGLRLELRGFDSINIEMQQRLTPPVASTLEEAISQAREISNQTPREDQLGIIRRYLSDKSGKYLKQ